MTARLAVLGLVLAAWAWAGAAPATSASEPEATIHVAAPAWGWLTEEDGSGLYWALLRAVYEPAGYELAIHTRPYSRAVQTVLSGKFDAWPGSYPQEHADAVYPDWHMDAEPVYAAYDPDIIESWANQESLRGRRVAWVRDYNYQKYLDVPVEAFRQNGRQAGLKQVAQGRVAAFLDARSSLEQALAESSLSDQLALGWVRAIELYMAYAPNARGRRLAAIWDRRFPELLADGTVADLYDDWDWPDPQWPFAAPSPFPESR